MSFSRFTRTSHRWIAAIFMVCVVANIVTNITGIGGETVALAVGLTTLAPLVLLMVSGSYLFVLPYIRNAGDSGKLE